MSRWIDADALTADIQERYCKPCKERKEDYNEVRCRVCWVDDAMDEIDGFADNSIDIVRCSECVYCNVQNTKYLYAICERHGIEFKPFEDDTRTHGCSWGERKDDDMY